MPKSLPVIDISAPCAAPRWRRGAMSDGDALAVALQLRKEALADQARVKIMSTCSARRPAKQVNNQLAAALRPQRWHRQPPLGPAARGRPGISDRRGMHVFHQVHILKPCGRAQRTLRLIREP